MGTTSTRVATASNSTRYYQRFDRSQIRVYLFEDLATDPAACVRDVFAFLGVDTTFVPPDLGEHNVSGVPRGRVQAALLRARAQVGPSLKRVVPPSLRTKIDRRLQSGLTRPPMPAAARAQLDDLYRADNEQSDASSDAICAPGSRPL